MENKRIRVRDNNDFLKSHIQFYLNELSKIEKEVLKIKHNNNIELVRLERHKILEGVKIIGEEEIIYPNRYIIHIKKKGSNPTDRIFLLSGTHGPEFFLGNVIHKLVLRNANKLLSNNCDIVLISNINPFGALNCTRPDCENIDCNRNGLTITDSSTAKIFPNNIFNNNISIIKKINNLSKYNISSILLLKIKVIFHLVRLWIFLGKNLSSAIFGGQSIDQDSPLTYSGRKTSGGVRFFVDAIIRYTEGVTFAYVIDIHTGLPGKKNCIITLDKQSKILADNIVKIIPSFQSVRYPTFSECLQSKNNKTLYSVSGTLIQTARKVSQTKNTLGLLVEMKSKQNPFLIALEIIIANIMVVQSRNGQKVKNKVKEKIMKKMRNIFYIENEKWRMNGINNVISLLEKLTKKDNVL